MIVVSIMVGNEVVVEGATEPVYVRLVSEDDGGEMEYYRCGRAGVVSQVDDEGEMENVDKALRIVGL